MKKSFCLAITSLCALMTGCLDMSINKDSVPFEFCPDGTTYVDFCPDGIRCTVLQDWQKCRQTCDAGYVFVDGECPNGIKCQELSDGGICRMQCGQVYENYSEVTKCPDNVECKQMKDGGWCMENCPSGYAFAVDNKCPAGIEDKCVTLDSNVVCQPFGCFGGNCQNEGANCPGGYITTSESEEKKCIDEDEMTEEEREEFDFGGDDFMCIKGKHRGKCRKTIECDPSSKNLSQFCKSMIAELDKNNIAYPEFPVLPSQLCSEEQLTPGADTLRIHIIDVGNGDSIWIQTPTGQNVLIDGGEALGTAVMAGPIVNDYLEFHNFPKGSTFDLVMLSHPHSDHFGGFNTIFANGNYNLKNYVDAMDMGTSQVSTASYTKWISLMSSKVEASHIYMPASAHFQGGDNFPTEFFGPDVTAQYMFSRSSFRSSNVNSASIFFRISYAGLSMVFAGDAEVQDEYEAMQEVPTLIANNFLKVCHHGSNTSSSDEYLQKVWGSIPIENRGAFISSGRRKYSGTRTMRPDVVKRIAGYVNANLFLSTNADDDYKDSDKDAVRDDNILIVIRNDGSYYACYEGVN